MSSFSILLGLFFTAFAAATIFPMQSEALLAALILKTSFSPVALVAVASIGNILGSCVNWWSGQYIERFKDRKWFPVKPSALGKARQHYERWGRWSLLLCWVPFIGDPITVMAGVMKEKLATFLVFVSIAKTARYIVLAVLTLHYAN